MGKKISIKYLLHGTYEVDKPNGWDDRSFEEKEAFMREKMINADKDILVEGARPDEDTTVEPMALVDLEDDDNEYPIMCPLWEDYVYHSDVSEALYLEKRRDRNERN